MSSLFGVNQSSRVVFVGEVQRGLACGCRCVGCHEPLIARQGEVREHHFAHASGLEPCEVSYESLLHRYAKQVIQDAGGLTVPVDPAVAGVLGLASTPEASVHLALVGIELEKSLQEVRPDLLGYTLDGAAVAIEVAYSSFCDLEKVDQFARLALPALEIDLRAFTPESFQPNEVRLAVLSSLAGKVWLWPAPVDHAASAAKPEPIEPTASFVSLEQARPRVPEEIVTISGRWVSIRTFASGNIAVTVVKYDPDLVSLVKTIAKVNFGTYSGKWKSWTIPRWRAEAARTELRELSQTVSIVLQVR